MQVLYIYVFIHFIHQTWIPWVLKQSLFKRDVFVGFSGMAHLRKTLPRPNDGNTAGKLGVSNCGEQDVSNEKRAPGWLGYIGDPSYRGIIS